MFCLPKTAWPPTSGFDVGREPRGAYRAAVPLAKHSANHSCQRRQLRSGSLRAVDLRPACAHATESGDAFMGSLASVRKAV